MRLFVNGQLLLTETGVTSIIDVVTKQATFVVVFGVNHIAGKLMDSRYYLPAILTFFVVIFFTPRIG